MRTAIALIALLALVASCGGGGGGRITPAPGGGDDPNYGSLSPNVPGVICKDLTSSDGHVIHLTIQIWEYNGPHLQLNLRTDEPVGAWADVSYSLFDGTGGLLENSHLVVQTNVGEMENAVVKEVPATAYAFRVTEWKADTWSSD